jgi:vacuolar-type H+-ATPase subunit E/Vma4
MDEELIEFTVTKYKREAELPFVAEFEAVSKDGSSRLHSTIRSILKRES